jgi:aryl-alcohol dehydrogenase-like predicted oxidoreductase
LIPGTSSIRHLEENMAAGDVELDELDMDRLGDAARLDRPVTAEH